MRHEEYKDMLIDKKEQELQVTAEHLGCTVEEIREGKTLEEKFAEYEILKKGWIMTKPNGEEFTKVTKVKVYTLKRTTKKEATANTTRIVGD